MPVHSTSPLSERATKSCLPNASLGACLDIQTVRRNFSRQTNLSANRAIAQFPLLAQSRHERVRCTCPLSGVKRTAWIIHVAGPLLQTIGGDFLKPITCR